MVAEYRERTPKQAKPILERILRQPEIGAASILVFPGGFIDLAVQEPQEARGWATNRKFLSKLRKREELDSRVEAMLPNQWHRRFRETGLAVCVVGVDMQVQGENIAQASVSFDVRSARQAWALKFWPTPRHKEGSAWRDEVVNTYHGGVIMDHVMQVEGKTVWVAVCHDLNVFNSRSMATRKRTTPRPARGDEVETALARNRPDIVLHLAHNSSSPALWSDALNRWVEKFPSVQCVTASSFCSKAALHRERDRTFRQCEPIDIIVTGNGRVCIAQ